MIKGGTGGSNTQTGLLYEAKIDLATYLGQQKGYRIDDTKVYYEEKLVARIFKKHTLYKFLKDNNIDWTKHISKQILPDNCIYVIINNTAFVLEVKHQEVAGSVDEKLQTCDFKRKQYIKLFSELNYRVEYCYILNDWFKQSQYKDVLDYIISVNCKYYFNYIPLQELGLPVPASIEEKPVQSFEL